MVCRLYKFGRDRGDFDHCSLNGLTTAQTYKAFFMSKIPTQRERLIAFFDSGKTLTRLTAWSELGILEAPARISELRSTNYPIATKMISVKNRYGEIVRVAEWRKIA